MGKFLENVVNQRFKEVYNYLLDQHLIRSKTDLAEKLETYNHVINNILKGERRITIDQLNKLFDLFNINANFLFGLSDDLLLDGAFLTRRVDELSETGKLNIKFIRDKRAFAGTALGLDVAEEAIQKFSIPDLEGDLYAIEIEGDSMMPTITNGDILVAEPIERGAPLRDNQVYIIITDIIVAKRIQQVKEGSVTVALRLISDNNEVYQPYTINLSEVRQLLRVKCRLTAYRMN